MGFIFSCLLSVSARLRAEPRKTVARRQEETKLLFQGNMGFYDESIETSVHSRMYPVQSIESISVYSINNAWASARGARELLHVAWRKLAGACGKAPLDHSSKSLGWNFIAQHRWSMEPCRSTETNDRPRKCSREPQRKRGIMHVLSTSALPSVYVGGYPTL
jgi:hypothetical protein